MQAYLLFVIPHLLRFLRQFQRRSQGPPETPGGDGGEISGVEKCGEIPLPGDRDSGAAAKSFVNHAKDIGLSHLQIRLTSHHRTLEETHERHPADISSIFTTLQESYTKLMYPGLDSDVMLRDCDH